MNVLDIVHCLGL